MVTQDAVSHGYFGCQRLQRIKALVRVLHRGLQIAVLLFQGFLVMAKSVVVSYFPQHAAVGTESSDYGDAPNEHECGKAMQNISRNDQLPELSGSRSNIKGVILAADHDMAPQAE